MNEPGNTGNESSQFNQQNMQIPNYPSGQNDNSSNYDLKMNNYDNADPYLRKEEGPSSYRQPEFPVINNNNYDRAYNTVDIPNSQSNYGSNNNFVSGSYNNSNQISSQPTTNINNYNSPSNIPSSSNYVL